MSTPDFQREPCTCEACTVAGVSKLAQRRDPFSGAWLHGKDARRWYEAKARLAEQLAKVKPKAMR